MEDLLHDHRDGVEAPCGDGRRSGVEGLQVDRDEVLQLLVDHDGVVVLGVEGLEDRGDVGVLVEVDLLVVRGGGDGVEVGGVEAVGRLLMTLLSPVGGICNINT